MRHTYEEFPEDIAGLVNHVRRDRDSPGPSLDQIRRDPALDRLMMGTGESDVEDYFRGRIFPKPEPPDSLQRADRYPMSKHTVPNPHPTFKVSNPAPDMLYGYDGAGAFPLQKPQLLSMEGQMVANNQNLIYPFFVIEFKADGPSGAGSLWVATNQCLGALASCVNIAERLNRQLKQCKSDIVKLINSAAFSIAISGTDARLHISWRNSELDYYMRTIKTFAVQEPEQYVEFRKYVRNIIDWGRDKRLKEIRDSLDILLEESRVATSEMAKSRPPPSDGASSSSGSRKRGPSHGHK
jgi:hypothetical protein